MPRHSDTRTRARDEFARLLTERGYPEIFLDEIAKTIGIRKASLYHHFPGGKQALYTAVAHHYIEQTAEVLHQALATEGAIRDRLIALADTYARGTYNTALGDRIYDATRHVDEATRSEISHAYVRALIQPVTDLMRQAMSVGELREADPGFLATAFMEMAAILQPLPDDLAMPLDERPQPSPDLPHALVDLFLHGAAPNRPAT